MHELGIVYEILKTVDEVSREQELEKVTKITLQVGEMSGVLPDYLVACWEMIRSETDYPDMEMVTETLPVIGMCRDCCKLYRLNACGRQCPYCGSSSYDIVTGREFKIKNIEAY